MSNKDNILSHIKYSVAGISVATLFAGIQTFIEVNGEYAVSQSAIYFNYAVIVMALAAAITFGIKAYLLFKDMSNEEKIAEKTTVLSLDFEDKALNKKVEDIKSIIENMNNKNDLVSYEDKMIVEKTLTNYIPTIAYNYVSIPDKLRKVKSDNQSAHSMVLQQLEIIESGLKEMQTTENVAHNKVMENMAHNKVYNAQA